MKRIVVGLTGSTGAGKSTVSHIFEANGFGIIDADKISRAVTEKDLPVLDALSAEFGNDIIKPDGNLDRALLAKRAFSNRGSSEKLNAIVHPAVMEIIERKVFEFQKKGVNPLIDAPLLFEANGDRLCDKIVSVIAPLETRCRRIMQRDSITFEAAMLRIKAQHDDEFYTSRSDFAIINDATRKELEIKTQEIIDTLLGAESNAKEKI